eukprot:CAMPEP_0172454238 /NCGR_PEP_ID=MMETSP1065-20121228/11288_1 /TAXON_ID=265537 /ORGANISM="Amphiprora paludosa, Strain CCMP125" /LENGTH=205 /DNA_ID=CAMNT_0013206531 /DNA_START=34 /DNA_END=651 /DNA_ORIENTATION=+
MVTGGGASRGAVRRTQYDRQRPRVCPWDDEDCQEEVEAQISKAKAANSGYVCQDRVETCNLHPAANDTRTLCIAEFADMKLDCPFTCGLCPSNMYADRKRGHATRMYNEEPQSMMFANSEQFIKSTDRYMYRNVYAKPQKYPTDVALQCVNKFADCSQWVTEGECIRNPSFMKTNCAPACKSCSALGEFLKTSREAEAEENRDEL